MASKARRALKRRWQQACTGRSERQTGREVPVKTPRGPVRFFARQGDDLVYRDAGGVRCDVRGWRLGPGFEPEAMRPAVVHGPRFRLTGAPSFREWLRQWTQAAA